MEITLHEPLQSDFHTGGDVTWLKVISSKSNDPHLSRLSGNLKQMQTIITNIIQYHQLICQGFTETSDSKLRQMR